MIKKALLAAVVGSVVACGTGATDDLGATSEPIIKGTSSGSAQDAVVLIAIFDTTASTVSFCSGALITPRLVLTARHCVSNTDESLACDVNGNPLEGSGNVYSDKPVSQFYIFTGPNRPDFTKSVVPSANAAKIITDGATNLCNHDIALIQLNHDIPDAKTLQVRFDSKPSAGDLITAVGWGVTATAEEPSVRQQRTGISILTVGPANTSDGAVSPNEMQVGESICEGDSGGPAIASSGALIGVVSRGGNGTTPAANDIAASCEGANTFNLYTRSDPFKDLITQAAANVGQTVWVEGEPNPALATNGSACNADSECQSAHCYQGTTCLADCSQTACASGTTCNADKICVASGSTTTVTKTGCSVAPGAPLSPDRGLGYGAFAAAALLLARRRRHRASP